MTETFTKEDGNTELWHTIFAVGHPDLSKQQEFHAKLPRDPRCRLCNAPFAGLGGLYMRFRGKVASSRNENYCNACDGFLDAYPGGAEVEMSMLFADIRNSTAFAESAGPKAASDRVNRFLDSATKAITDNDGFILAFYGDCIVAVWPPGFSGPDHAQMAVKAAQRDRGPCPCLCRGRAGRRRRAQGHGLYRHCTGGQGAFPRRLDLRGRSERDRAPCSLGGGGRGAGKQGNSGCSRRDG